MRPLHDINPVRLDYIFRQAAGLRGDAGDAAGGGALRGLSALDVGCGGGLVSEPLARQGADVLGIDMAAELLQVARTHAADTAEADAAADADADLTLEYRLCTAADLLQGKKRWDLVTCLEVLEHVPDPSELVRQCTELLRPGGRAVFATLNRTPVSFAAAIVGAEYLMGLLPKGTHQYEMLIRPAELVQWARNAGLVLEDLTGLRYNPLTHSARLSSNVSINYMAAFSRP